MSCNAVAVVSAKVDLSTVASALRLLGKENLLKIVAAYAQKKSESGEINSYVNGFGETVFGLKTKDYRYPFEIVVGRSGVEVRGIYGSQAETLTAEIGKLLNKATVLVLGNKVEASLGRKARITEDRTTESGARVIGFEF